MRAFSFISQHGAPRILCLMKAVFYALLIVLITSAAEAQYLETTDVKDNEKASWTIEPFPKQLAKFDSYPWEILVIEDIKNTLDQSPPVRERHWIIELTLGPRNKFVIDDLKNQFVLISVCRPRYCDQQYAYLVFDPARSGLFGVIYENHSVTWINQPPKYIKRFLLSVNHGKK